MRISYWLVVAAVSGCVGANHHIRVMDARRTPRVGLCDDPPIENDHGPDRPRVALAIVTAECGTSHEEECHRELVAGTCQADADALIDVARQRTPDGHLRMVGTAVEFLPPGQ